MATIASTRTRAGLRVEAELDSGSYPVGLAVTREQFRALPVRAHAQHGEWNYTIAPTGPAGSVPLAFNERAEAQARALALLSDERLTGMSTEELARLADLLAPDQTAQAAQRAMSNAADDDGAPPAPAAAVCSPTPTGSWSPSSIYVRPVPNTCWPICWASIRTRSAWRSPRPASCSPARSDDHPGRAAFQHRRAAHQIRLRQRGPADPIPVARPAGRPGPDRVARRPGRDDGSGWADPGVPGRVAEGVRGLSTRVSTNAETMLDSRSAPPTSSRCSCSRAITDGDTLLIGLLLRSSVLNTRHDRAGHPHLQER